MGLLPQVSVWCSANPVAFPLCGRMLLRCCGGRSSGGLRLLRMPACLSRKWRRGFRSPGRTALPEFSFTVTAIRSLWGWCLRLWNCLGRFLAALLPISMPVAAGWLGRSDIQRITTMCLALSASGSFSLRCALRIRTVSWLLVLLAVIRFVILRASARCIRRFCCARYSRLAPRPQTKVCAT